VHYYIRQLKKHVSGPHEAALIRRWAKIGKVNADMDFSKDGVEWMFGIEMVDLFPRWPLPQLKRKPLWTYRGRCA